MSATQPGVPWPPYPRMQDLPPFPEPASSSKEASSSEEPQDRLRPQIHPDSGLAACVGAAADSEVPREYPARHDQNEASGLESRFCPGGLLFGSPQI